MIQPITATRQYAYLRGLAEVAPLPFSRVQVRACTILVIEFAGREIGIHHLIADGCITASSGLGFAS